MPKVAAAMRASMPEQDYNIDALLARIAKLEKAVAEGVKVAVEKVEKDLNLSALVLRRGLFINR